MIIYFHHKLSHSNSTATLLIYLKFPIIFEKRREGERQERKHSRRFKSWIQAGISGSPHISQNMFPKSMDGLTKFEILPWIPKAHKWQNKYSICECLSGQYSQRALFVFFTLRSLKPCMYFINEQRARTIAQFALSNSSPDYIPDGGWVKGEMKSYFPK